MALRRLTVLCDEHPYPSPNQLCTPLEVKVNGLFVGLRDAFCGGPVLGRQAEELLAPGKPLTFEEWFGNEMKS